MAAIYYFLKKAGSRLFGEALAWGRKPRKGAGVMSIFKPWTRARSLLSRPPLGVGRRLIAPLVVTSRNSIQKFTSALRLSDRQDDLTNAGLGPLSFHLGQSTDSGVADQEHHQLPARDLRRASPIWASATPEHGRVPC